MITSCLGLSHLVRHCFLEFVYRIGYFFLKCIVKLLLLDDMLAELRMLVLVEFDEIILELNDLVDRDVIEEATYRREHDHDLILYRYR